MNATAEQYPFVNRDPRLGSAGLVPLLPITLVGPGTVSAFGMLDSGAAVNVLPFSVGEQLGIAWEKQTIILPLTGNLARYEARVVVISVVVGKFAPVQLAFAWAQTDEVPLLLGQVNFFQEFDICFFRSRSLFEVRPNNQSP